MPGSRYDNGMWPPSNGHKYSDEEDRLVLAETGSAAVGEPGKVHQRFTGIPAAAGERSSGELVKY